MKLEAQLYLNFENLFSRDIYTGLKQHTKIIQTVPFFSLIAFSIRKYLLLLDWTRISLTKLIFILPISLDVQMVD